MRCHGWYFQFNHVESRFVRFPMLASCQTKTSVAHQGTIVFATTPELLGNQKAVVAPTAWTSKKVPRVVRSTLSAGQPP